ncbi:Helicase associated domain protein [Streptomyces sp. NBC_00012]|uniref:helicase associated domain-containing protein n=1 Tax=unclassified Streptomyces TaxID=2593676 RepID=UPI0032468483
MPYTVVTPKDWGGVGGYPLGQWIADQRRAYTAGTLEAGRVTELEKLGIVWSEQEAAWADRAAAARGHFFPPTTATWEGHPIEVWAKNARGSPKGAGEREQRRPRPPRPVVVYDEYGPVRMIRTAEWKYVHRYSHGPHELYHLATDPGERDNLAADGSQSKRIEELRRLLDSWFQEHGDPARDGSRLPVTGAGQRAARQRSAGRLRPAPGEGAAGCCDAEVRVDSPAAELVREYAEGVGRGRRRGPTWDQQGPSERSRRLPGHEQVPGAPGESAHAPLNGVDRHGQPQVGEPGGQSV